MSDIIQLLDKYADYQSQVDLLRLDYEAKRRAIQATIQAQLDELDTEYKPVMEAAQGNIADLESQIKETVKTGGATVKGKYFQAVYVRGRVSWDTKALDGYAIAHPEIAAMRKEGEPSVSLRKV